MKRINRCRECRRELWNPGRRLCYQCFDEWLEKRKKAWVQAKKEFGEITKENLSDLKKRTYQLERETEKRTKEEGG